MPCLGVQTERKPKSPVKPIPIYCIDMPGTAWALLWWMICRMDVHGEIKGGWRAAAAREMRRHPRWINRCGEHLARHGLIQIEAHARWARVNTEKLSG
jgi:hypothetical protein